VKPNNRTFKPLTLKLLILFLVPIIFAVPFVKANTDEPISYTSGVTVYSPVNTTYTTNNVILNLTFMWGLGMDCSLNYSIDEAEQQPIPLVKQDSDIHVTVPFTGSVELPPLANGQHILSIYVSAESASYSNAWTHIICFTIDGDSNIIPEFSSWLILSLFLVCSFVIVLFKKKIQY